MSFARHRRFSRAVVLCLAFAVTSGLASSLASSPARAEDGTQHAKELFQQGSTLFNLGDFDKAIEAWQAGYKEKPDPTFLYNIGQAYRLKGDAAKALFFYRGYLRNAPKGAFRAEVEAKIAALQKGGDAKPLGATPAPATPAATPPPSPTPPSSGTPTPVAPAPVAPGPRSVAPPPVEAPPIPEPMSPPSTGDLGPTPQPPAPAPELDTHARPFDVQFALGLNKFTSGVNVRGSVPAQLALDVAVGYTFGAGDGPARFRLGAFFGSTSLVEKTTPSNKLGFASALLEPSVRVRIVPRRVYVVLGVGLGVLGVSNLKINSVLLAKGKAATVNGTIPLFETRFSASAQVRVTQAVMLTVTPAFSISPKGEAFVGPIGRFELMFGVGYSF